MSAQKFALSPQPFHNSLESIQTLFKGKRIGDPLSGPGFDAVLSSEAYQDLYVKEVGKNVSEEGMKSVYESLVNNTLRDVKNPFAPGSVDMGREGMDAMAPSSNYNQFARLNPFTILGYLARSKVIDLYNTIHHDQPTITYEYNLEYVVRGDDPTKLPLPFAIRDGSLTGLLDLPKAIPQVSVDAPWVEALPTGPAAANENWIKIGSSGNLLTESGFPVMKHSIERNVAISKIYYSIPTIAAGGPKTGVLEVYLDRGFMEGDIAKRVFNETFQIPYVDGTTNKVANATLIGVIHLDSGEYSIGQAGNFITHFMFAASVTNLANEMGTVRAGNHKIVETFDVNNRVTGTVPITPAMADDFNAAGEGVTWTAYMIDKLTEVYAGLRDLDLERELDRSFAKPKEKFRLYPKLGGYTADAPFILTARGSGGGDPFSWQRDGLRDMIRHILTKADVSTNFDAGTPRSWVLYGAEADIQRIPEITYTNYGGEVDDGAAPGNYRYGFSVDTAAGFADNFGRRVKVIGSRDSRRYGKPIVGVLKSMSMEQPTTVYFPYSFRVFSGISPEYRNVPALCIFQRDFIGTLTQSQIRITLQGNDVDLYQKAAAFSAGK